MLIKTNTAVATQITKRMMDGKDPFPKQCKLLKSVVCGVEIGEGEAWYLPTQLEKRRKLEIGDWVIHGVFESNVLTNEEFEYLSLDL